MSEAEHKGEKTPNPSHDLLPDVKKLLDKTKEEKIMAIEKEGYIPYPKAEAILGELERMHTRGGQGGALLFGPARNGKTTILKVFRKRHPQSSTPDFEKIPVLFVETPEQPGATRFLGAMLEAFGFKDYDKDSFERRRLRVLKLLEGTQTRIVLIDEFHNLLSGSPRLKEQTCLLIKELSNTFQMPIILTGTERAEHVLSYDAQLPMRFSPANLPAWTSGNRLCAFLRLIETTLPLPSASNLDCAEKSEYILKRSQGILQPMILGVKEAAIIAVLEDSEKIAMKHLEKSHFSPLRFP